jgi:uncharacterized membrane protein YkoI
VKTGLAGALGLALAGSCAMAAGPRPREHAALRQEVEQGRLMPLAAIRRRIDVQMHGSDYLGAEYFSEERVYRLKYLKGGQVIWIDVDARTGRIVGRARP